MIALSNHIILLGFKHVGKSTVGASIATALKRHFYDLDACLAANFTADYQRVLTCRMIMHEYGEHFYRQREQEALRLLLNKPFGIVALGGGTASIVHNQCLIKAHQLIHLTAPQGIVFERIALQGRPAFFSPDEDFLTTFNRLWRERDAIYRQIAHVTIVNDGTVQAAVQKVMRYLSREKVADEF